MSKRAERRGHLARMKAKARRVARESWGQVPANGWTPEDAAECQRRAEKWANHLAMCSCMGCGHQRWWFGLTMQERRAFQE